MTGNLQNFEINTRSCGTSLQAHKTSLSARATAAGFDGTWGGADFPVGVDEFSLTAGWREATDITLSGYLLGEAVTASLDTSAIEVLLSGADLPLAIRAEGAGATVTLNGSLTAPGISDAGTARHLLDAKLRLNVLQVGTLHAWTGIAANSAIPLVLKTGIRIKDTEVFLEALDARIGHSDLSGHIQWSTQSNEPHLHADISSRRIDLQQLESLLPAVEDDEQKSARQTTNRSRRRFDLEQPIIPAGFKGL